MFVFAMFKTNFSGNKIWGGTKILGGSAPKCPRGSGPDVAYILKHVNFCNNHFTGDSFISRSRTSESYFRFIFA